MIELIGLCNGGERISALLPVMDHRNRSASVCKILSRGYEIILGKTSVLVAPMQPAERRGSIGSKAISEAARRASNRSTGARLPDVQPARPPWMPVMARLKSAKFNAASAKPGWEASLLAAPRRSAGRQRIDQRRQSMHSKILSERISPAREKSASAALRPTRLKVTCDHGDDDDGGDVPFSLPSSRLSPISPQPLSR
jgi:hypothetical protein